MFWFDLLTFQIIDLQPSKIWKVWRLKEGGILRPVPCASVWMEHWSPFMVCFWVPGTGTSVKPGRHAILWCESLGGLILNETNSLWFYIKDKWSKVTFFLPSWRKFKFWKVQLTTPERSQRIARSLTLTVSGGIKWMCSFCKGGLTIDISIYIISQNSEDVAKRPMPTPVVFLLLTSIISSGIESPFIVNHDMYMRGKVFHNCTSLLCWREA